MSNMNSRTRQITYEYLKLRDGEYCRICGVSDEDKLLMVDHIDNDNSNNTPKNLQLLCRRCNYNKNPRGAKAEHSTLWGCVQIHNSTYLWRLESTGKKNLSLENMS